MRRDGRTDMTKVTVVFRNFGNAPKTISFGNTFQVRQAWLSPTPPLRSKHDCQTAVDIDFTYQKIRSVSLEALHCVHGLRYDMDSVPPRKVRSQAKPCEICGQNGTGTGFLSESFGPPPVDIIFHSSTIDCMQQGVARTWHAQVACTECSSHSCHAFESGRERHWERFAKQIKS